MVTGFYSYRSTKKHSTPGKSNRAPPEIRGVLKWLDSLVQKGAFKLKD